MAGLNLQLGYGAGGGVDALRVLIAEKLKQQIADDQKAAEQARIAEAQARSAEQSRQFGISTAQTAEQNQLTRDQQKTLLDLTQAFQRTEAEKGRSFTTSERVGTQGFTAGENEAERKFRTSERTGSQLFSAGQNELGRTFTGQQNELGRKNQVYLSNLGGQQSLAQIIAHGVQERLTQASKPANPPNADQTANQTFYEIMASAIPQINAVEDQLTNQDLAVINNSPLPGLVNNSLLSKAGQQYNSALMEFGAAWLRKVSGAAINKDEWAQIKASAGRQVGDHPDTVVQKRQFRAVKADALASGAGPAYTQKYGRPYGGEARRAGMGEIPFIGEERVIDGKRAKWDGQGWEEIK